MKLTFLGATHEVTGSCTLIETNGKYILVDNGMEQGKDIFVNRELPVNAEDIECVFLTHAHIDHSGNLPLLYKNGFRGKVYATIPTCNLCQIMLRDSAHIQMFEAEWRNRKKKRCGKELCEPLYDMDDAEGLLQLLHPCNYESKVQVLENVSVRFNDVGHLLGSSFIEIWITENNITKKIVFSGDIGNTNQPLLKDPKPINEADYVVMESTYGNRYHNRASDYITELSELIQKTFDRGGNVIIPSFAVGRTQEMLYFLRQIKAEKRVKGHGNFSVYVDSPLAIEATGIFIQCDTGCFDAETSALIEKGINPIVFPGLKLSVSADDSKAINVDQEPKIIISASGMCEAGRIRHHLKHNLWREESLILFVGYQAVRTLGRIILDGAKTVKLFDEEIAVKAEIHSLANISGHADKQGLLNWINSIKEKPHTLFVNHGEDTVCDEFAECLKNEYGYNAVAPFSGASYELITGEVVLSPEGERIKKATGGQNPRTAAVFERLISAANKLVTVANNSAGLPNKELAKFADQINNLSNKWAK